MSIRRMPQAENGGKMCQGTREFTGASVMIVFVPVYALVAKALAQTRPLQHAPGLVLALCFAGLGLAWTLPIMPQIRWREKPSPGT
jgi:tellurite resistance protein TehA-like permease